MGVDGTASEITFNNRFWFNIPVLASQLLCRLVCWLTQILTCSELRISHVLGLCQCPEDSSSSSNSNNNNENASSKKRLRRWRHSNIGFICSKVDILLFTLYLRNFIKIQVLKITSKPLIALLE